MSKVDRTDIKEQIAASIRNFSLFAKDEAARQRTVIEMPEFIKKKAALISAHFLLPAGSKVVDMGCETGEVSYALALINPRLKIIGVDSDPAAIEFARKTYKLPNLLFLASDFSVPDIEDGSVDGIINSNVLHHVYSVGGYNPEDVSQLLEKQLRKLKTGGTMLIRDYVMPPDDQYVLIEFPATPSSGSAPEQLSDADLLVRFSQEARPMASGCEGFFIEEQAPRREGTRLFRVPHKWAKEYIHRKNYRKNWEKELKEEYTFFTWQDYRRECSRLGMRMVFSAPYWNPWVVKTCFKGRFQLYGEDYTPMQSPPTNYFIVAQKVGDKQSLMLEERRPSQKPTGDLQIMIVRDKKSGELHELVKRPGEYCDVVPYRVTPDNRLIIYVRGGYPRPIVNAVMRGCANLDGKKWSGHLIEPISMDAAAMTGDVEANRKMIFGHVQAYAGLRPKSETGWHVGDTYFPSPDRIDEAIEPVFVEVENPQKASWPISGDKDVAFTEAGAITELDASDVILASQVGLLPDPRLELYVIALMNRYNIPLPRWIGEGMPGIPALPVKVHDPEDVLEDAEPVEFEKAKKGAIHLRPVKAVFVEEGKVGKATRGLAAQDIEFIVTDDGVENIAVVMPVSRDWDDNLLVALDPKILPVPNRIGGKGAMLNAPSFVLPKEVKNVEEAKGFVARQFGVDTNHVGRLGESYFTHAGVTPQRVYPFYVFSTAKASAGSRMRYMMVKRLFRLGCFSRFSSDTLKLISRLQMRMNDNHDMQLNKNMDQARNKGFELSTDKVAVEEKHSGYSFVPSRILAQRGDVAPAAAPAAVAEVVLDGDLMPPRVGKRLTQCYAQAKSPVVEDEKIKMKETPTVVKIDKDIERVGEQLKLKKPERP